MTVEVVVGGIRKGELIAKIEAHLTESEPTVTGIVSAFVSIAGVKRMCSVLDRCGRPACRLVAGTDYSITHPRALYVARETGWDVRLGNSSFGIFHPKLIVAGDRFDSRGCIANPSFAYVGSGNLTEAALMNNVECAVIARGHEIVRGAAAAFTALWRQATPADDQSLEDYSARFAVRSRARPPAELEALGVSDTRRVKDASWGVLMNQGASPDGAVSHTHAEAAWAGLQSFTGEYTFQVEFPRAPGEVIRQLIGSSALENDYVEVLCSDNAVRRMKFCFYPHNGMFRLNIPNDLSGVQWARRHRDGVAVVKRSCEGEIPIRLDIYQPGIDANEINARSYALGTWGRTSTRLYGWF